MAFNAESFRRAVEMNDEAHRKTIREMDMDTGEFGDRQEAFKEIQREARMWLRHLDVIHERL